MSLADISNSKTLYSYYRRKCYKLPIPEKDIKATILRELGTVYKEPIVSCFLVIIYAFPSDTPMNIPELDWFRVYGLFIHMKALKLSLVK